jgi:hypothetical protein
VTKLIGKDNKRYGSVEPGLGVEGARYLAERLVAMVGADIYILENMETAEMVKDAVQAIINPIAIK